MIFAVRLMSNARTWTSRPTSVQTKNVPGTGLRKIVHTGVLNVRQETTMIHLTEPVSPSQWFTLWNQRVPRSDTAASCSSYCSGVPRNVASVALTSSHLICSLSTLHYTIRLDGLYDNSTILRFVVVSTRRASTSLVPVCYELINRVLWIRIVRGDKSDVIKLWTMCAVYETHCYCWYCCCCCCCCYYYYYYFRQPNNFLSSSNLDQSPKVNFWKLVTGLLQVLSSNSQHYYYYYYYYLKCTDKSEAFTVS